MSDVTKQVSANAPVFTDISNEKYREYTFPDMVVRVDNPVQLNVKRKPEGDSHRIVDANGKAFYIPAGWRMLAWEGKNGVAYSF